MFAIEGTLDTIGLFFNSFLIMTVLFYFADTNFENMRDYMRGSDHAFNTYRDSSVAQA